MLDQIMAGLTVAAIAAAVAAHFRTARLLATLSAQIESVIRECDAQREDIDRLQLAARGKRS